ncbi:hypothetical protein CMI45_02260 [Candidatus Pacearchaeota archaeon]|nr:hypothetical protein [Candidatus Pacearchaeota archaeon]|tara:strand:+ start:278 stop:577 length:300 start_codon:yes stop_codon:yes gene_type:complete
MGLLLIIILVFLAFIVVYLYQAQNLHGPFINFLIAVSILLIIISLAIVYVDSSADLTSFDGVIGFIKAYFSWLGSIMGNGAKIAGYVVNQDWGVNDTIG